MSVTFDENTPEIVTEYDAIIPLLVKDEGEPVVKLATSLGRGKLILSISEMLRTVITSSFHS
jgi:hypothetical protein